MKLSEAASKIIGIQVGELAIDLIRSGLPNVKVRFALLAEEQSIAGFMDIDNMGHWSQKTLDAMRAFTEALEEDGLRIIFKVDTQATETPRSDGPAEPAQF